MVQSLVDAGVEDPVEELVASVVESCGFELVDLLQQRGKRALLRVSIDMPSGDSGVTVADCAAVSRMLGPALDAEDVIRGAYVLEVSSPGVERALKRPKDFVRFQGKSARFKLISPLDGRDMLSGLIAESDDESVTVNVGGEAVRLEFGVIAEANLEFHFEQRK